MPSGSRRLSRGSRGSVTSHGEMGSSFRNPAVIPILEPPNLPKHFPFPVYSADSDLFFEISLSVFAIVGTMLQFLHLYRTVWWLPNSYTNTTMNFYLIDSNLLLLIVILLLRRPYYLLCCKLTSKMSSSKSDSDLSYLSRSFLSLLYASIIGVLAAMVLGNRGKMDIIYLFYPISLYLPIFGLKIRPFFEVTAWCSNGIQPIHACSSSPIDIRKECEHLKANFLDRLRQIFFTSMLNAYYGSFIPCCFAQSELVYDRWWNMELGAFIFFGSMTFSFAHMIPLRYCDILHRAVLHSGTWEKLDNERNLVLVTHEWRDDILWPGGAVVKYNKSVWRAMGDCNFIIPGEKALTWGYQLFILPIYPLGFVLTFHSLMVLYQLYNVMHSIYWYRVLTLSLMVFFNFYPLYKILRDTVLSYTLYKQSEESDDEKATQSDLQNVAGSNRHHKNLRSKTEESPFCQDQAHSDNDTDDR